MTGVTETVDHGALAALLVPTPTASILGVIRIILRRHNILEEGSHWTYSKCEQLPGIDADQILAKLQAAPAVAMNPHVDNATAIGSMRAAVQRAGFSFIWKTGWDAPCGARIIG
jgi:hypothetical protein